MPFILANGIVVYAYNFIIVISVICIIIIKIFTSHFTIRIVVIDVIGVPFVRPVHVRTPLHFFFALRSELVLLPLHVIVRIRLGITLAVQALDYALCNFLLFSGRVISISEFVFFPILVLRVVDSFDKVFFVLQQLFGPLEHIRIYFGVVFVVSIDVGLKGDSVFVINGVSQMSELGRPFFILLVQFFDFPGVYCIAMTVVDVVVVIVFCGRRVRVLGASVQLIALHLLLVYLV